MGPTQCPCQKPPGICEQSSITRRPWRWALSMIASISAMREPRWTGRMARVRSVTAASAAVASMHHDSGSMSTKTGTAPMYIGAAAVATNVSAGMITSSPGPTPAAFSATSSAVVPLAVQTPERAVWYEANASAKRAAWTLGEGKPPQFPLSTTSASAATSRSSCTGHDANGSRHRGLPPSMASVSGPDHLGAIAAL